MQKEEMRWEDEEREEEIIESEKEWKLSEECTQQERIELWSKSI